MRKATKAPTEAELIDEAKNARKSSQSYGTLAVILIFMATLIEVGAFTPIFSGTSITMYVAITIYVFAILFAGISVYEKLCATDLTTQAIYLATKSE